VLVFRVSHSLSFNKLHAYGNITSAIYVNRISTHCGKVGSLTVRRRSVQPVSLFSVMLFGAFYQFRLRQPWKSADPCCRHQPIQQSERAAHPGWYDIKQLRRGVVWARHPADSADHWHGHRRDRAHRADSPNGAPLPPARSATRGTTPNSGANAGHGCQQALALSDQIAVRAPRCVISLVRARAPECLPAETESQT
jgi:hypothetical protein